MPHRQWDGWDVTEVAMNRSKTVTILDVAEDTFQDLRERLDAAGMLDEFIEEDGAGTTLTFGTVAIRSEDDPQASHGE